MRRLFAATLLLLSSAGLAHAQQQDYPAQYPASGQGDAPAASTNLPRGLELTVGVGGAVEAKYPGSDDYDLVFKPAINLQYNNTVFLVHDRQSMMTPYEGLGYKFYNDPNFTLGINATYNEGRDNEGPIRLLDDVNSTAFGGVFAAYHPGMFYARGNLGYDMLDEVNSYKGEFGIGLTGALNPSWSGMLDLSTTLVGDNYAKSYFGVTGAQSVATGLAAYKPDGGFYKTSLAGTLQYQFTQGMFLQGIMRYDRLNGDSADSPVVEDKGKLSAQAMAGYRF